MTKKKKKGETYFEKGKGRIAYIRFIFFKVPKDKKLLLLYLRS